MELPADFLEAAAGEGLRRSALQAYLALQGSIFAGWLARLFPAFRDRLIADPRFFFKVRPYLGFYQITLSWMLDALLSVRLHEYCYSFMKLELKDAGFVSMSSEG